MTSCYQLVHQRLSKRCSIFFSQLLFEVISFKENTVELLYCKLQSPVVKNSTVCEELSTNLVTEVKIAT